MDGQTDRSAGAVIPCSFPPSSDGNRDCGALLEGSEQSTGGLQGNPPQLQTKAAALWQKGTCWESTTAPKGGLCSLTAPFPSVKGIPSAKSQGQDLWL